MATTNTKDFIDLTREIALIRNRSKPGDNFLAIALKKIHDAIRALQTKA